MARKSFLKHSDQPEQLCTRCPQVHLHTWRSQMRWLESVLMIRPIRNTRRPTPSRLPNQNGISSREQKFMPASRLVPVPPDKERKGGFAEVMNSRVSA